MLRELLLIFLFIPLLANLGAAQASYTTCPSGFTLAGFRCFKHQTTQASYTNAKLNCQDLPVAAGEASPRLADPRTPTENQHILDACRANDGIMPSAFDVWDANMGTIATDPPTTNQNPPAPKISDLVTSYARRLCVCPVPTWGSYDTYANWCISGTGNYGEGHVSSTACTLPPTTSGTDTSCGSRRVACRRPAIHPAPSKTGRGACWIGLSRRGVNSLGVLEFESAVGVSALYESTPSYMEPNLKATGTTFATQGVYTRTPAYGSVFAPPNCVAMWGYRAPTPSWVLDYCNKPLPSMCVADAMCIAGYYRSTLFAVAANGAVTEPACSLCPGGKYRASTDLQSGCKDCNAGRFGDAGEVRTSPECSGPCPTGTWCSVGSPAPIPCGPTYYGNAGSGFTTADDACLPCKPGRFCSASITLESEMNTNLCRAGYCGTERQSTDTCSQSCPPGHFCPAGSACPGTPCGQGIYGTNGYCPDGSQTPIKIEVGKYGTGETPQTFSAAVDCPQGYYCLAGFRYPCPEGQYAASSFPLAERTSCKPCNSGYYCQGPLPSSPNDPTSTSPTREKCAPEGDPYPAQYFCVNGIRYRLPDDSTRMTIPVNVAPELREGDQACPLDKICSRGVAYDRLTWDSCPGNKINVTIPELWNTQDTSVLVKASLFYTLSLADYHLDYRILNQSFYDRNALVTHSVKPASCKLGATRNDGIFDIDLATGRLRLKRYSPDDFDPSKALDFEVCEPITDVQYNVLVQASARQKVGSIQANLTCMLTVAVEDVNDRPVFDRTVYHRVMKEGAKENTQAARCSGVSAFSGCPDDATPLEDNAVSATDQDSFGQGNLKYQFVGVVPGSAHSKLTINSCTGLISQGSGPANVLRFSDPTIPEYAPGFKRLTYTVMAEDDGNGNPLNVLSSTTTVHVYLQNVNDAPVFTSPPDMEIWIPESTSAKRAPEGTRTLPDTLAYMDEDEDTVTLFLARNDASAFRIVGNKIETTFEGSNILDYESIKREYSIDIEARDNGVPPMSSFITVTIKVANLNDPPIIEPNPAFFILENAAPGDIVCRGDESTRCSAADNDPIHRISSTDPDNIPADVTTYQLTKNPGNKFAIDTLTGQVKLAPGAALNFEDITLDTMLGTGRSYVLEVTAFSSGAGIETAFPSMLRVENATRSFNVFIVDVNEDPVITTSNAEAFKVVETWPVGVVLDEAVIEAYDPDNVDLVLKGVAAPQQTLSFSAVANPGDAADGDSYFSVSNDPSNPLRARIVLKKALDYETAPICAGGIRCYRLTVRAKDNGNSPEGKQDKVFTFEVVDVNEPPVFTRNRYDLTLPENVTYASIHNLVSSVDMVAHDPDSGGDLGLVYTVVGGDGFAEFSITPGAAGQPFSAYKRADVLLDYETKPTYTLRVLVTDTLGKSSSIGRACVLSGGESLGCNEGAVCINSRCHEKCQDFADAANQIIIQASTVPRVNRFFCYDYTNTATGVHAVPGFFRETAEVQLVFTVTDANDPPYIVARPQLIPRPNLLDNAACQLKGSIQFQNINLPDLYAFRSILVWDDDVPNPGPNAGPFTFAKVTGTGTVWDHFDLETSTGAVSFPPCHASVGPKLCGAYSLNNVFLGKIEVADAANLKSRCDLNITLADLNTVPNLGADFAVPGILEGAGPILNETGIEVPFVVFPGFSNAELNLIDNDRAAGTDDLTFFSTFSAYFEVDTKTARITLKKPLDYESSQAEGFAKKILISVRDTRGASDSIQITVPVIDVNEAPDWNKAPKNIAGVHAISLPENSVGIVEVLSTLTNDPDTYNAVWSTTSVSIVPIPEENCNAACLPFEITPDGTALAVKEGRVLDFESPVRSWTFLLRVTDTPGLFADMRTTITLTDVNEPPRFIGTGVAQVDEGPAGVNGMELLDMSQFVTDPDAADPPGSLVFNLTTGNEGGLFEVRNGRLRLTPNQVLDFEDVRQYVLGVNVTDTRNHTAMGSVTVNVRNLNDVTVSSIALLSASTLSCTGSNTQVEILGTNFGLKADPAGTTVAVTYRRSVSSGQPAAPSFTAQNCAVQGPGNTRITCTLNRGAAGLNYIFSVSITVNTLIVGDSVSDLPSNIGFPAPTLVSVSNVNNMPTSGGRSIELTGTCLGSGADALSFGTTTTGDSFVEFCRVVDNVCVALPNCVANSANGTKISCTNSIPPGLGSSVRFRVQVARQTSASLVQGGYGAPTVTATSFSSLKTNGDMPAPGLVITGTNFGALGSAPSAATLVYTEPIGGARSFALLSCTVTTAFTQVTCQRSEHGFGVGLSLFLTFGGQVNPSSPLLSFEPPRVTGITTPGNVASPSKGGLLVTIAGASFGPVCGNPGVSSTDGAVNCKFVRASYTRGSVSTSTGLPIVYYPQFCAIVSHESIVCATVPGTGKDHKWTLIVAGQTAASTNHTTRYSSPTVGSYSGDGASGASTRGNQFVDIEGNHFGPEGGAPIVVTYGNEDNPNEFTAANCHVLLEHVTIRCSTAVGAGDSLAWRVIVDEQLSRSELSNYAPPTVTAVNKTSGGVSATGMNVDGGQTVLVFGTNFAPALVPALPLPPYLEQVVYGPPSAPLLYDVTSRCTVTSHETMSCRLLPGSGADMSWKVTVRGQSSAASPARTSYAVPTLSSISVSNGTSAGGTSLTLVAVNLPFCDPNAKIRVAFGNVLVDTYSVTSSASVDPIDLETVCATELGLSALPSAQRKMLIAVPEMMGSDRVTVRVRVESPVYSGGSLETAALPFAYNAPEIHEVYAEPGDTGSSIRVTLAGVNFCKSEACCQTYLGDTQLLEESIISHDHNVIVFIASGPGQAYVKCPSASTRVVDFSSRNPFVYGAVKVLGLARLDSTTFDTRGTEDVYVYSLYAAASLTLTIGGKTVANPVVEPFDCMSDSPGYVPDTIGSITALIVPGQQCYRVTARVPAGEGLLNEVIIQVGSLKSKADDYRFEFLRYTAPSVSALSSTFSVAHPTTGATNVLLEVTGTNFGTKGSIVFGPAAQFGTRNEISCSSTSPGAVWTHTRVACPVPAGEGQNLAIRVLVGGQFSPAMSGGRLDYLPPAITSFQVLGSADNTADTMGGETLVITGTNFGRPYDANAVATSPGFLPTVNFGFNYACRIVSSTHTEVRCIIPVGDGAGLDLILGAQRDIPAVIAPTKFAYSAPVIYYITPANGSTSGLTPSGSRQLFQVVGRNFGATDTKLEFYTGGGGVFLLGQRRPTEFLNTFLQINHTSLLVYLPAFVGKNINVTVTASRQSNVGGPTFSYNPPEVTGVTVIRTTPSGRTSTETIDVNAASRRRLQQAGDVEPTISNIGWSSRGFGHCLYLPSNDTVLGSTLAYRTSLDISPGGAYTQTYTIHALNDYVSATMDACTAENQIAMASRTGLFVDHYELPTVGCMRAYEQTVTTVSGEIPPALFPEGGFGVYLVSDRIDLYTSIPSFPTLDLAQNSSDTADFTFEDVRTATLTNGRVQDTITRIVPTNGCEDGFWEDISDYQRRLDESTSFAILPRKCLKPVIIEVNGENYGTDCSPMITDCILFISLVDEARNMQYDASTTSSEGNHGMLCDTCYRSNFQASFHVPFGAGRNLRLNVTVGGQTTLTDPLFHYEVPVVDKLSPGTLNAGNSFQSASSNAEAIQVTGSNLGYTNTSLSVLMNGRQCTNATWISGRLEREGKDSLECTNSPDVAGMKSIFLCVGGQTKMVPISRYVSDVAALQYGQQVSAWNTSGAPTNRAVANTVRSLSVSRCPAGTYGRLGEICLPCPEGGICNPGFSRPVAQPDFFVLSMNASSERANTSGACQRARIDPSFRASYPDLVQFELCDQVVKCIPADSCLGENKCAVGYEYQLKRCNLVRNQTDSDNSCRVWFDGKTKQYRGVHADCQRHTVPGASCDHDHPEDCSSCNVRFDSATAQPIGVCECTVSERCSLCTASEYYRLNGKCIECPDNPALVFTLFILAGLAVIALAYWFQKKKINLAFISIGVDYFQVLAVLSTTNVPWPPIIQAIFQVFFIFLASIDIAAPECLVPNFEFSTKFYLTELMPALALVILLIIHTVYTLAKVYRFGKEAKWLSHVSRLVGIYVLIIYVLYLSLTKKALDVFNCNPLDPDDGFSYTTFSSLSCDGGGLCRCGEPGGVQESLIIPAIIFLVIYTFGFPLTVFSIVSTYREQIREDQYLRANLLGDRRETNPRAYDVRKKFQLMYMHFKPKYTYWMLSILGRKFGIAFASLMFRGNPAFQLAVVLIVLFIAFTMQVSLRPYMSPGEYPVVVKELNDNSRKADEDLERYARDREMYRKVGECLRIQAEIMRKEKMHRHKMGAGFWEESKAAAREHDKRSATEKYFFDLNAVESTLLGCLIIISLSGIMFESGRFQTRGDLAWQGDLIITLVFIVLFGSLLYYFLVLINELAPHSFARYCGRFFLRYQNEGLSQEDLDRMKDNELQLDANPLFAATGPIGDKSKSLMKEIEASKNALALAKRQNDELKRLKSELEAQGGGQTVSNPLVGSSPVFHQIITDRLSNGQPPT